MKSEATSDISKRFNTTDLPILSLSLLVTEVCSIRSTHKLRDDNELIGRYLTKPVILVSKLILSETIQGKPDA